MSRDAIDAILTNYLSNRGYHLSHYVPYQIPGCSTVLDGYDPAKRVGYLILSEHNGDADVYVHWRADFDYDRYTLGLLLEYPHARRKHRLGPAIDDTHIADFRRRELAFRILLNELQRDQVNLEELRELQAHVEETDDRILILSRFDTRFSIDEGTDRYEQRRESIVRVAREFFGE